MVEMGRLESLKSLAFYPLFGTNLNRITKMVEI